MDSARSATSGGLSGYVGFVVIGVGVLLGLGLVGWRLAGRR